EIRNADLYLFLNSNPTRENPVLGWQVKRRMKYGTNAIVINSGEIDLTHYATVWADPRRGTATVLLNAIMAELIKNGHVNETFIKEKTVNFEQIKTEITKHDLEEAASVAGVSPATIKEMVKLLSDPSKKIVAFYNLDSRIDRAPDDLKALATLMLLLGKIGVEGSGIALTSGECNHAGMQLAGFDNRLLPGGNLINNNDALKNVGAVWQCDLNSTIEQSGVNLQRKIRNNDIRAAIILGENPAKDPQFNHFINHLDFLVVADMFKTETVQMADVFLPLSSYLENYGHLTNWSGMKQLTKPIGEPVNGMHNADIIKTLIELFDHSVSFNSFDELVSEINYLYEKSGISIPLESSFPTPDKKAHFVLYSSDISTTPAAFTHILEIDARIADRTKLIKA
ncbi:MAG: molybdopterin-dependent oxidoreductase, partial [FCB group bacterium]|nr:molybdopterin-dependent oxidoreductase [FCB group bacterium]